MNAFPEEYYDPGTPDKLPVISTDLFNSAIEAWSNNALTPRTAADRSRKFYRFDNVHPSEVDDLGQLWRDAGVNMVTPGALMASVHESPDRDDAIRPGRNQLNDDLGFHLRSENAPHSILGVGRWGPLVLSDNAIMMHVEDNEGNRQIRVVDADAHLREKDFPLHQSLDDYKRRADEAGWRLEEDPTFNDESAAHRHERAHELKTGGAKALADYDALMQGGYMVPPSMGRTAHFNAGRRRRD